MSVRILTLFDDEPVLPQPEPVAKKKRVPKEKISDAVIEVAQKPIKNKVNGVQPEHIAIMADQAEKNYYSIGETANMFQVRTSHIRFWTVQFGLKMRTTRKGDRLYTPENIEQLRKIHHLVKEQGFTIAGAKAKLKELKKIPASPAKNNDIISILKALRANLILLRKQV